MVRQHWSHVSLFWSKSEFRLTTNRWAIGAVTGPAVGEALAQRSQWRWIFWINLPFSLTAFGILCVFASLKARAPGSMLVQLRNYDWIGFGLLTGSMMSILVGISWVSHISNFQVFAAMLHPAGPGYFVESRRSTLTTELGRYRLQVEPSQHVATASVWTPRAYRLSHLVMVFADRFNRQLGWTDGPHDPVDVHWPYDSRSDHIMCRVLHGKSESVCDFHRCTRLS